MGEVIEFGNERAIEVVKSQIREGFHRRGFAMQPIDTMTVPVDVWRKTARAVGRELKRGVQTLIVGGDVHALLRDWPRDEREVGIFRKAMFEAVKTAALVPPQLRPLN